MALTDAPVVRSTEAVLPGLDGPSASPVRQQRKEPSPHNLWHDLIDLSAAAEANPEADGAAALPGDHVLLATVWPAKLPKGTAAPSASLLSSLGGETATGKGILIYKVPSPCPSLAVQGLHTAHAFIDTAMTCAVHVIHETYQNL